MRAEQQKANDEANAFDLAEIINTSDVDSEPGDGIPRTGGLIPTEKDRLESERTARVTRAVPLNKIGLARVNAMRAAKKLPLRVAGRDLQVAPIGADLETMAPQAGPAVASAGARRAEEPAAGADGDAGQELVLLSLPASVDNSTLQYFPPRYNRKLWMKKGSVSF